MHGTVRDLPERLLQDLDALPHLLHAHVEARIDVATGEGHDIEIEPVVDRIRLGSADVVKHPAAAQLRAGAAQRDRIFGRQIANANATRLKDLVADQIALHLVELARQAFEHDLLALVQPALGQIARHAAEAHIVAHHAAARNPLEQIQYQLALAMAYSSGVKKAPRSLRNVPTENRWLTILVSSAMMTRRYSARSGGLYSSPSSFSAAIA